MLTFWLFLIVGLKIPVCIACWILYNAVHDVPEQTIGEQGNDGGTSFKPGPRVRDPHGGAGAARRAFERSLTAHDQEARDRPKHDRAAATTAPAREEREGLPPATCLCKILGR